MLKEFRFSQIVGRIQKSNKNVTVEKQLKKKPVERLENKQNLESNDESNNSALSISDAEVEISPITKEELDIPEKCRAVNAEAGVELLKVVDDDAK